MIMDISYPDSELVEIEGYFATDFHEGKEQSQEVLSPFDCKTSKAFILSLKIYKETEEILILQRN